MNNNCEYTGQINSDKIQVLEMSFSDEIIEFDQCDA